MTNTDGTARVGYEEQLRQWIESSSPITDFSLSGTGEGGESVRSVDAALRNVLWDLVDAYGDQSRKKSNGSGRIDVDRKGLELEATILGRFVDVMVSLCEKEMASPNLPATVFTDLFDTLTISRCERLFHLVEQRIQLWKRPAFFAPCKNQLLRMCNDLLRRLSKGQNTVFCGQILIVLAKLFPLSERSGLNIVSEFNTEHLTIRSDHSTSGEEGSPSAGLGDEKEVSTVDREGTSSVTADSGSSGSGKINLNLYRRFWNLQEFFRQPNLCYNANHWKQMTRCSQEVLTVFSSFRLDEHATPIKPTETYFAKYLTSKKLFELELSDSNFRRCILIQFLIMFHYLKASVRFKLESQVLSEDQFQWVREKSAEIYKLLEQTPPDGKEFARSIAAMMAREEMWNAWKNDNCPAFRVADALERKLVRRKRPIGDDIRDHLAKGQISMGSAELTRLFNICPDNWEACRGERRNYVPSMEDFFEEAIAQADPAACIEDQYKLTSNPNWGWRALRILSQKSLHFFTSTNQPAKSLPNYLDTMVGYLAKDLSVTKEGSKENSNGATTGVKVDEVDDNSQDDFKVLMDRQEKNRASN
ncbi:THO complex subunit 1-like [Tropilaelaps mercedesae]|uniref:THO complex subunit 1-like n=1 Tax=Tropilaelaps mercedesae TaxID=418985 RepID=A0A1V9X2A5_9ACAR|nr:THO complex subunit 1-like [Tropilaelaps mercedesae]